MIKFNNYEAHKFKEQTIDQNLDVEEGAMYWDSLHLHLTQPISPAGARNIVN